MGKSLDDARLDSQILGLMKPSGDGDGGRQLQTDKKLRLSLSVSRVFTETPCSHPHTIGGIHRYGLAARAVHKRLAPFAVRSKASNCRTKGAGEAWP